MIYVCSLGINCSVVLCHRLEGFLGLWKFSVLLPHTNKNWVKGEKYTSEFPSKGDLKIAACLIVARPQPSKSCIILRQRHIFQSLESQMRAYDYLLTITFYMEEDVVILELVYPNLPMVHNTVLVTC